MTIAPEKKRCLILSCSATKNEVPEPIPALQRYTGPAYQVLHRYLREKPETMVPPEVYVISAQYGLIDSETYIPPYDLKMTPARALELRADVLRRVQEEIVPVAYEEIFLSMGRTYLLALEGLSAMLDSKTSLIVSRGSAGRKLTELRNWLWGIDSSISQGEEQAVSPNMERVTAVLRGRTLSLTTFEVETHLQSALLAAPDSAQQIRGWYANVCGAKVGPKWAAHQLFGVPVGEFSADEARRVLRRLGLNCCRI